MSRLVCGLILFQIRLMTSLLSLWWSSSYTFFLVFGSSPIFNGRIFLIYCAKILRLPRFGVGVAVWWATTLYLTCYSTAAVTCSNYLVCKICSHSICLSSLISVNNRLGMFSKCAVAGDFCSGPSMAPRNFLRASGLILGQKFIRNCQMLSLLSTFP